MKFKLTIRKEIKFVIGLVILAGLIAFSEVSREELHINNIIIRIDNLEENHYLDEEAVVSLMGLNSENLRGATLNRIGMRDIENRIRADRYVKEAQLFADLKGNLVVQAVLRRPIARIIRTDGSHAYVAEDGTIMPVSRKYTSRVLLIGGRYASTLINQENLYNSEEGTAIMDLIYTIRNDKFWNAQLTQINIDMNGYAKIYPQVGGQLIELGRIEQIEDKLKRLRIFYKEILPRKGWNTYKRVNLEYENQIIAE